MTTTTTDLSGLRADVALAADVVAPMWPLTSFVAVNPLGGLQHLSFDDATAAARRWLGARTHPSLAEQRAAHARGVVTDADLRRAVLEVVPEVADVPVPPLGGRAVDAVELVRLDLLHGPEEVVARAPGPGQLDEELERTVDALVATWCAAFVDEAGVAWALPGREQGLFAAWRRLAPHDRRLRRATGRGAAAWLDRLPERAVEALHVALVALGVEPGQRTDALRAQLGRLPGWASYAKWCDEWAPDDRQGPHLRLVELLAVRAATAAALSHARHDTAAAARSGPGGTGAGDTGPTETGATGPDPRRARVAAVLDALDLPDDPRATEAVAAVLRHVPGPVRDAVWLAAAEGSFRDRLLRLLPPQEHPDRDPAADGAQPDVQAAFCIDVRSEGLRRHLEQVGGHETLGFAGFFGVPMRWRPLGSTRAQPRAPVLVTPRHEVVERPLPGQDAGRHLALLRGARSGHEAFHAAKGGLASPFALAEASGWVLGPLAAARTLVPTLVGRLARRAAAGTGAPATRPAVAVEDDPDSGMALEERVLFAEAILRTMGLTRFARLVVLCGHGSRNVNNPHGSSYDCGACAGAPGGASGRTAAAILNDPAVRAGLAERGLEVPDTTWFVGAQHDTVSDTVTVLDRTQVPEAHRTLVQRFERDAAVAGERLARERAPRLPGDPARVRVRGDDWAQVRPEWGLAGNAAFVVGPRSVTRDVDLACRAFLHSYDAEDDPDGVALETIMTAPLVVGQWISAQYYFSTVAPDVFGAGDKMLHNPVGGIGVVLGEGGDLRVGLPAQGVAAGDRRVHEPLRLLALVQAPVERTEAIVRRNQVLRELLGGRWMTLVARDHAGAPWQARSASGEWSPWSPAAPRVDRAPEPLELR